MTGRRRRWRLPTRSAAESTPADVDIELVRDLAHALLRAERSDEAFQFALDRTCPAVGAAVGAVYLVDGASELMRLEAAFGWPPRWRPWLGEMRVRLGFGPSGEAASERRVIEIPDILALGGLEDWQEVAQDIGFRSLVALPLEAPDAILGVATFYFAVPGTPSATTRRLLGGAADLMAVMADRELLRTRLRRAEAALADQQSPPPPRTEERKASDDNEATDG
jgi:GAF domain-containing protein